MDNSDIRILVVDDAPDILCATVRVFRKEGFDVISADTGAQCLERVEKDHPDLILLDVELPDILSTEVCE
jgi:CheY-like chemotaxis protein